MPHSGARSAYWSLTAARDVGFPPADFGPLLSFVGVRGAAGRPPSPDWHVESPCGALCQDDLHAAMLSRRTR